jgi:sirohydrochlorin ferrochelatase
MPQLTADDTRSALIVAHGQPSDPGPAEAALQSLAKQVSATLPGWRIAAATLAAPGALAARVREFGGEAPLIYPFFMADGWFTRTNLPRRLAETGMDAPVILDPFGNDPLVHDLVASVLSETLRAEGWRAEDTTTILAAHGARRGAGSALATTRVADAVRAAHRFFDLRIGFIEEPPLIEDAAWGAGAQALCLPLFVAHGGHVAEDLPRALQEAGFEGRLLPPIGAEARAPGLIAAALRRALGG